MSRIAILVLGMHRSGTSALTWLLGQLGAALPGDSIDPHADNARGYFESAGLVAADDQLLRVARSSWFDPRPLDLSRLWPSAIRSRKDRIGEAIARGWGTAPILAIKDPRQCRFVPFVADVLQEMSAEPRAVLMLRDPAEIVRSVAGRDATSAAYAYLLWLRHMIDAERGSRGMRRVVVSYDAMLADWRSVVARLAPLVGRAGWTADAAQATEIEDFLDPGLRHHRDLPADPLEEPLAGIVAAVKQSLAALERADDEAARAGLDRAYAMLDAVPWLEGDIVHDELRHRRMPEAPDDVAAAAPEPGVVPAPERESEPELEEGEQADLIRRSGLFDEAWYRATYLDAAASDLHPIDHYLRIGAAQGHNPSPLFDTGYYARQMARRLAGRPPA
jgi:hypothetical protein